MAKLDILYIFRRPTIKILVDFKNAAIPEDVLYGAVGLKRKHRLKVTDKFFQHRWLISAQYSIDRIISPFLGIGFSIIPSVTLLPDVKKSNIVFATTDSLGVPLALLKSLRIFSTRLVINTTGLYDGLRKKNNNLQLKFWRKILKNVDHFICGQSFQECSKLSTLLNLPIQKFTFIPFGIDTKFFRNGPKDEKNEILAIGADPNRDWELYRTVAQRLPKEKFRIITYKGLISIPMPENVTFEYNVSYPELRQRIWQAKCILILSKMNFHFAGQSTSFRCMACAKPVIFTDTPGISEYKFRHKVHCLLVPIGNSDTVLESIAYLNRSRRIRDAMSFKARQLIKKYYGIEQYTRHLEKMFQSL